MDLQSKQRELDALQSRVAELEREVNQMATPKVQTPPQYYVAYELMGGMVLGLLGAAASLLFNIIGATMVGKHPLELIRVYLTFPMGEKALQLDADFALAAGACLYLFTGMIGGIPIHMILSRWFGPSTRGLRFVAATVLGIGVWLVNYYGLIAWLQPALIGGNWIIERIPIYVAVATHLVFAWTILAAHRFGQFLPEDASQPGSSTPTGAAHHTDDMKGSA